MTDYLIPFNCPSLAGKELEYMLLAVAAGHISGDGSFTKKCQALLEEILEVPKVLLTTSCTHALEMAALLLGIQAGDEFIIPSFTFVSTANSFVLRGARPVFADIRADTLNLDESLLEDLVTPRTRAIVPVHYAGVGCEMDTILQIADRHSIAVVEDSAHGVFGKYKGRYLGTWGCLAALSFHETKNVTCGEGGALLINEPQYVERAEIIREKGTDRSRFFRGQVDKYTWQGLGSSYLPSDLLAAFLYAQLEERDRSQAKRRRIWEHYNDQLQDWAGAREVRLPAVPPHCEQSYHMFYLLMAAPDDRNALILHLKTRNILSVFHYLPLHLSPMGAQWGGLPGDQPVTERVSECLVRLPFYTALTVEDQDRIIEAVREWPAV